MYHTIPFWLVEVSIEKLADNLWEFHFILFVTFPFFYYFIFVFNFHHFDYYVFQCVPPWVYPAWDSFCFLDLGTFPILGNFSAIISSNIFSGPFYLSSGTPIMRMLVHLMLSQRSPRLSPFIFICFSIFCSVAVISTILSFRSLIHSSASAILLIPSSVLFLSVCTLVLLVSWETFLASSQSFLPFFIQDPGSSSLSLFWILFLEGCLSPLHLLVFLEFYTVHSCETKPSAFSSWLTFYGVVLVLATEVLCSCFFCLPSGRWD